MTREALLGTPAEAVVVVASTVTMYLALVVLVRILGQRMLSAMSTFDLAAIIAFGAVIGRTALGEIPHLAGGLLALITLVALQALVGALRALEIGGRAVSVRPRLLMAGGQIAWDQLRRSHVTLSELQSRLRIAGVHNYDEVAAVILESNGTISVLRRGQPIEPDLLRDVVGGDRVPPEFLIS